VRSQTSRVGIAGVLFVSGLEDDRGVDDTAGDRKRNIAIFQWIDYTQTSLQTSLLLIGLDQGLENIHQPSSVNSPIHSWDGEG